MDKSLILIKSSSSLIQSHDINLDNNNVKISKEILDELVCLVVENIQIKLICLTKIYC